MSNIPIIGEQPVTFALCYDITRTPECNSFEEYLQWLLIAFFPANLDGTVMCRPAFLPLWEEKVQSIFKDPNKFISLRKENLVSPAEFGIVISRNPIEIDAISTDNNELLL